MKFIRDVLSAARADGVVYGNSGRDSALAGISVKLKHQLCFEVTVGGGIRNVNDMFNALKAGAEKISIDSMSVRNPQIISDGAKAFGSQCVVLSTQVKQVSASPQIPSGYEVYIDGARVASGMDAIEWIKRGQDLGAGEICLNSIDNDGTLSGYNLELIRLAGAAVTVPLIASGGAGKPEHLKTLFLDTDAQAAIISSMLYSPRMERNFSVRELKAYLAENNINVRPITERNRAMRKLQNFNP